MVPSGQRFEPPSFALSYLEKGTLTKCLFQFGLFDHLGFWVPRAFFADERKTHEERKTALPHLPHGPQTALLGARYCLELSTGKKYLVRPDFSSSTS